MSNQCPYCGSLRNVCVSPVSFKYVCLACEKFFNKGEQPKQTVFDRITQSPEVLAEKLVFVLAPGLFTSHIIDTVHESWQDAYAATVAKLKEVCDE